MIHAVIPFSLQKVIIIVYVHRSNISLWMCGRADSCGNPLGLCYYTPDGFPVMQRERVIRIVYVHKSNIFLWMCGRSNSCGSPLGLCYTQDGFPVI
jgi:hypothetical protein